MKPARRYGIVVGLALLGTGVLLVNRRGRREVPADEVEQQLEAVLRELVARKQVKHAIIAIESGDGAFRWIGAAGEAHPDGTPMREDTPFFIASVTKLFTAAVILKLHEQGRLGLEEPISAYLPSALIAGLHRLRGVDHTHALTVRHLLSHTSGLPDYFEEAPKGGRSLAERLFTEADRAWNVEEVVRIARDDLKPHFPPQHHDAGRRKVRYADTNYQLLGAIIEAVTGQPLQRVFEEMLFEPLELRQTYLYGHTPPEDLPAPATLWADEQALHLPLALRSIGPEGGLVSTAGELLTFLRALARGEVFDDPATLQLMQEQWNRFGLPRDRASLRLPGWPIEYGLGMMRFRLPRLLTPTQPMPAVIGHSGSTGSWLFYCPEMDLFLAGTVDQASAGAVPYRVVPRLLRVLEAAGFALSLPARSAAGAGPAQAPRGSRR
jgi:D-alanyl-D-alanine carboxypeptidase